MATINPVSNTPKIRSLTFNFAETGKTVNKSFKTAQDGLIQSQKSIEKINSILQKRISSRKENFSKIFEAERLRKIQSDRIRREEELEATKIPTSQTSSTIESITNAASAAGGGFLNRLMKVIGFTLVGALLKYIPPLVGYAKEFIARIGEFGRIIGSFVNNTIEIFKSTLGLLDSLKENFLKLDFFDSENRVKNSFEELQKDIEGLSKDFQDTVDLFTTDLTKEIDGVEYGTYSGEEIPGVGGYQQEQEPGQDYAAGSGTGTGATGGTREQRALLDAISFAEGTPSYGTIYGGAVVPELAKGELTIREVLQMQKTGKVRGRNAGYKRDGYNSDATGRYQFMSYTLKEEVERQGVSLDEKFTPQMQDRLILGRMSRMRGVTPELLAKEGISKNVVDKLAPEFASFPNLFGPDAAGRVGTNTSYYGQGGKKYEDIVREYNKSLQSQQSTTAKVSPQQSAVPSIGTGRAIFGETGRVRNAPNWVHGHFQTNTGTVNDLINDTAPIVKGLLDSGVTPELSGGQKFTKNMSMEQIKSLLRVGVSQHTHSGDGRSVDIFVPKGTKVPFPVYDVRSGTGNEGISAIIPGSGKVWVGHLDPKSKSGGELKPTSSTPAAQISSAPAQQAQQKVAQQITPERKSQDIVANVPQTAMQQSSQVVPEPPIKQSRTPSIGDMLNNFMKQKILLDTSFL